MRLAVLVPPFGALIVLGAILRARDQDAPKSLGELACGPLAAAATLAIADRARALLQPVPTSARIRLARRVAIVVPVIALAVAALLGADRIVYSHSAITPTVPPLVALITAAVAVHAALSRRFSEHSSEAAATFAALWPVSAAMIPARVVPETITMAWLIHPWPVIAAGIAVTFWATSGVSA